MQKTAGKTGGFTLRSVGYIGKQRNLARTLDGLRESPLVLGAGAGRTLGQDFGTVGHVLAQFRNVLVVDIFHFIDTESAYFPSLSVAARSFSLHEKRLLFSRIFPLERQLVVSRHLLKVRGRAGCKSGGLGCHAVIARLAVSARFGELHVVRDDLRAAAVVAVPVLPGADLQRAADKGRHALGEVLGGEFRIVSPAHNVDKVGLLLGVLAVTAVDGEGKAGDGNVVRGPSQLGIGGESADQ